MLPRVELPLGSVAYPAVGDPSANYHGVGVLRS